MYKILLAQPCYSGSTNRDSLLAATMSVSQREDIDVIFESYASSALAHSFNQLWRSALNASAKGLITHFAMLHNDVVPEAYWLDKLLGVMERTGDDLVSCAIPIKDNRGLTSCGIGDPSSPWDTRRLTMVELQTLPETFNRADTVESGFNPENWPLVFNTGCWIADMRNTAWRGVDKNGVADFYFTMNDEVFQLPSGEFSIRFEPEDWYFSRRCNEHEMRYSITREVKIKHHGECDYGNDTVWGRWQIDETWRQRCE